MKTELDSVKSQISKNITETKNVVRKSKSENTIHPRLRKKSKNKIEPIRKRTLKRP